MIWQELKKINWWITGTVLILGILGIVFIYSAGFDGEKINPIYQKQIVWWLIGFLGFVLAYYVDFRTLGSNAYILYALSIFILMGVLFKGRISHGAQSWINIAGFSLQPSEIMKLVMVFVLARYLSDHQLEKHRLKFLFMPFILSIIPLILIIKQPDLGTAMIFMPIIFAMVFAAGARLKYLINLMIVSAMSIPFFWMFLHEYQKDRIRVFLNPNIDPLGTGYTAIQSKIAIGSGKLLGKGWLMGTQNHLKFLPERHTDFIFSVFAEEMGFVGCMVLLLLFIFFIYQGLRITDQSNEIFSQLLGVGITIMVAAHVIINIAMTIGLMPITGIPLPFLSYGGSNLLTMMISFGLLQNICRNRMIF